MCVSNTCSRAHDHSLDIPPNVPALLRFMNDTLVSMHPPKPQNKVASMWLICIATRVVDTCPVKRLCEVIGALQDGLCMWVTVQYQLSSAHGGGVCVRCGWIPSLLSSTITVKEDGTSDVTETLQDSNPFITCTKRNYSQRQKSHAAVRYVVRSGSAPQPVMCQVSYRSHERGYHCCGINTCTEGWEVAEG